MSRKNNRHPTKEKGKNSPSAPTSVSCGKTEKAIIGWVANNQGEAMNKKQVATALGLARTTFRDALARCIQKKVIHYDAYTYTLTDIGKSILTHTNLGGGSSRRGWRKRQNLSYHNQRFTLEYSKSPEVSKESLEVLGGHITQHKHMKNHVQYSVKFEDATIIFYPKKTTLILHDIVVANTHQGALEVLDKLSKYAYKLHKAGFEVVGTLWERGDYARVESVFADIMEKRLGKYELKLKDGSRVWIDRSLGVPEDETDSEELRERLDGFLNDMTTTSANLSDIDKIDERLDKLVRISANIVEVQSKQMQQGHGLPKLELGRADYFG